MNVFKRIVKNSLYLSARTVINKALYLVLTISIIKFLGVEGLGVYAFFSSTVWLVIYLLYLDVYTLGVRIISRCKVKRSEVFTNLLFTSFLVWVIKVFIVVIFINIFQVVPSELKIVIYLALFANLFTLFVSSATSVFYSHEKMEYPSSVGVITDAFVVGTSLILLKQGYGVIGLLIVNALGEVVRFLLSALVLRKIFFVFSFKEVNPKLSWWLFKKSMPFTITRLGNLVGRRVTVVLLMSFTGPAFTGFYTAACKVMDFCIDLLNNFLSSVFPQLSLQYVRSKNRLVALYKKSLLITLASGLVMCASLLIFSEQILSRLFGEEFILAANTLRILSVAGLIYFLVKINVVYLYAVNKQVIVMLLALLSLAQEIFLLVFLIPIFGIEGAAIAFMASVFLILILSSIFIYKDKNLSLINQTHKLSYLGFKRLIR